MSCVSRKARIDREGKYANKCDKIDNYMDSDQFHRGKEVADFEGGGFRRVRAVRAVHLDAGAEIVADGAGRGFLGVGGAHGFAPFGDSAIGFEDHGKDFAGAHKVGKFAEERTLAMDGVEAASFLLGEAHGFDGDKLEASLVNARENLTLKISTDCIRFDNRESALSCHENIPPNLMRLKAGLKPASTNQKS